MTVNSKKRFIINVAYFALIAVILYFVMKYLLVWLLPFVIGLICAFILQKPVAWLTEKTKLPRALWSILLVIVLITVITAAAVLLVYSMSSAVGGLVDTLKNGLPALTESFSNISQKFSSWISQIPGGLANAVRSAPQTLATKGLDMISSAFTGLATGMIEFFPSFLLVTVIAIVASCFITIDYNKITNFILRQFSTKHQTIIIKTKSLFMVNIMKVVFGYLLIMAITFVELLLGMWLIGVKYAAVISLLIAFIDLLPVLGTGAVLIPWGIIDLIRGNTLRGIEILAIYIVITVIRNFIEPKIIGKQVGLPAIATLISMYVGLELFGLFGLWGLPILAIIIVKLQEAGLIRIWKTDKSDNSGKDDSAADQNEPPPENPETSEATASAE